MEVKNLTTRVLAYIRNQIVTGVLEPGQKLNENDLASSLEISRHPIREAFRVLEGEQLVYSVPNKGAFVCKLSYSDLFELCQAREMIECYAVELLKRKGNPDLSELESALEEASTLSAPVSDDPEQYLKFRKAFVHFHSAMIRACGNSKLVYFHRSIAANLARYQYRSLLMPGSLEVNNREHHGILGALKKGAYEEAKDLLGQHINKRLQGVSKIEF